MSETKGVCPVCNGTKHVPVPEQSQKYKNVLAGYNKEDDSLDCQNCGGQYMWGNPSGEVNFRADGTPCRHEYKSRRAGRCLTEYTCIFCSDRYQIDSGD